jgi:hypothetical protein
MVTYNSFEMYVLPVANLAHRNVFRCRMLNKRCKWNSLQPMVLVRYMK